MSDRARVEEEPREPGAGLTAGPEPGDDLETVFHDGHGNLFSPWDGQSMIRVGDVVIRHGDAIAHRFNNYPPALARVAALEREAKEWAALNNGSLDFVQRNRERLARIEALADEWEDAGYPPMMVSELRRAMEADHD